MKRFYSIRNEVGYTWSRSSTTPQVTPTVNYKDHNGNNASFTTFAWDDGKKYKTWGNVGFNSKRVSFTSYSRTLYKGVGGPEPGTYRDGTLFGLNHRMKVIGVRIRHGAVIYGLGFIYEDYSEFFVGGQDAGREEIIYFGDNEYITNIVFSPEVQQYKCIAHLAIYTNRGIPSYGPYGTPYNEPYQQVVDNYQKRVIALLGEESYSNALGSKVIRNIALCAI